MNSRKSLVYLLLVLGTIILSLFIDWTSMFQVSWGILGLIVFFVAVLIFGNESLFISVAAVNVKTALRQRGYLGIRFSDARMLWRLYGKNVYKLPPWEQAAAIPGFERVAMKELMYLLDLIQEIDPKFEEFHEFVKSVVATRKSGETLSDARELPHD